MDGIGEMLKKRKYNFNIMMNSVIGYRATEEKKIKDYHYKRYISARQKLTNELSVPKNCLDEFVKSNGYEIIEVPQK